MNDESLVLYIYQDKLSTREKSINAAPMAIKPKRMSIFQTKLFSISFKLTKNNKYYRVYIYVFNYFRYCIAILQTSNFNTKQKNNTLFFSLDFNNHLCRTFLSTKLKSMHPICGWNHFIKFKKTLYNETLHIC